MVEYTHNSQADSNPNGGLYDYVLLKNEKLTNALYLVTNLLSDKEPIKWQLREAALELVKRIASGRGTSVLYRNSVLQEIFKLLDQVIDLLAVAQSGSTVSEMNAVVLREGYLSLKKAIGERLGGDNLRQYLHTNLELPAETKQATGLPPRPAVISKQQPTVVASEDPRPKLTSQSEVKSGRKDQILAFLQGKSWTSIKDIADHIPDVSQKTIQRELATLVFQGYLRKKGDRRWSRYVLARP